VIKGSLEQAVKAGKRCLASSGHRPAEVSVLINSGIHRDGHYAEPAVACFIQKKLDINPEFQERQTLAFDLQNGGSGMLSGAYVLANMMQSGHIQTGMVVSSEGNYDHQPDPNYDYPASGAAIMMDISPVAGKGFGGFCFKTFDEYSDLYTSAVSLKVKKGKILIKRKKELERTYIKCIPQVWEELLQTEGLAPGAIDFVIPSQISPSFVGKLPKTLGLPKEKILDVTDFLDDTLTTSPILALQRAIDKKIITKNQTLVFLTAGSGITIGAAVYYM
jgi:3-oxoacyl-[acyl-carrier-protein] synthase-3